MRGIGVGPGSGLVGNGAAETGEVVEIPGEVSLGGDGAARSSQVRDKAGDPAVGHAGDGPLVDVALSIIGGITQVGEAELTQIGCADHLSRDLSGASQRRHQHRDQRREDRHDDQQFHKRECIKSAAHSQDAPRHPCKGRGHVAGLPRKPPGKGAPEEKLMRSREPGQQRRRQASSPSSTQPAGRAAGVGTEVGRTTPKSIVGS